MSGSVSYHAGVAAENAVALAYERNGYEISARRWRSQAGEIDLIARHADEIVFVEVKKSRTHDSAAHALGARQIERIYASAAIYLDQEPDGSNTKARFDVALVNSAGRIRILRNAISV